MGYLETTLSSKLSPFVALGKKGFDGFVNKFNGDAELLDDLVRIFFFPCLRSELIVVLRMIIGRPSTTRSLFCI
jgi:hypothetical protein